MKMTIKVVHINSRQAPNTHREYCGRAGRGQEGVLGNPYWMNDESKREEVCDKFQLYLLSKMFSSNAVSKRIHELVTIAKTQDIELACFCAPKRCHAESIKQTIERLLEDEQCSYTL